MEAAMLRLSVEDGSGSGSVTTLGGANLGAEQAWVSQVSLQPRAPPPPACSLFRSAECPYACALRLVSGCPPVPQQQFVAKSPQYLVLTELDRWLKSQQSQPPGPAAPLRLRALRLALDQNNLAFIKLTVRLYRVKLDPSDFHPLLEELLRARKYRVACQFVMSLQMQDAVSVEKLLIPLLLTDKWNLIDDYLATCSRAETLQFIKYLDGLVETKAHRLGVIKQYLDDNPVPNVRWEKLDPKPLGKFMIRLCKKIDEPQEICENLVRNRAMGGIRFLIRQRYKDRCINDEVWNDWVSDTVKESPGLLREFIDLVSQNDPREALKWCRHYDFPPADYPYEVKMHLRQSPDVPPVGEEIRDGAPAASPPPSYHKLALPDSDVVFVDSWEVFRQNQECLWSASIVGIDCEWKPSFGTKQSTVSLLQIATRSKVIILDVMQTVRCAPMWNLLCDKVFKNTNVIKIGFGLNADIVEITGSIPSMSSVKFDEMGYLEMAHLWRTLSNVGIKLPYPKNNAGEGLSSLVEQCFDLPLDKSEQCSNWENRPLRRSQLEYAALDAYVLLEVYDLLSKLCLDRNIDINDLCHKVMTKWKHNKVRRTKRKRYIPKNRQQKKNDDNRPSNSGQ